MNKSSAKWNITLSVFKLPAIFLIIFFSIALWRYVATGKVFYILNFGYIGTALAIGSFLNSALPRKHVQWGRRITQLLIGFYMVFFLGVIAGENMQIEGFFFYLLGGVFAGAALHYLIAKIGGAVIFGRGWCGWACWTAMVLDLLPWKRNKEGRIPFAGLFRYVHLFISLGLVLYIWFFFNGKTTFFSPGIELYWLAVGNTVYYLLGLALAIVLKDNRAFCKYVCPIAVIQKIPTRFSIIKFKIDNEKCTNCGLCEKNCPMDIKLLEYKRKGQRILSTECILCAVCSDVCPKKAITADFGFDVT